MTPTKPSRKQSFTAADVREIERVVQALLGDVRALGDALESQPRAQPLVVDAGQEMRKGIKYIGKWLTKCREQLSEATYEINLPSESGGPQNGATPPPKRSRKSE